MKLKLNEKKLSRHRIRDWTIIRGYIQIQIHPLWRKTEKKNWFWFFCYAIGIAIEREKKYRTKKVSMINTNRNDKNCMSASNKIEIWIKIKRDRNRIDNETTKTATPKKASIIIFYNHLSSKCTRDNEHDDDVPDLIFHSVRNVRNDRKTFIYVLLCMYYYIASEWGERMVT